MWSLSVGHLHPLLSFSNHSMSTSESSAKFSVDRGSGTTVGAMGSERPWLGHSIALRSSKDAHGALNAPLSTLASSSPALIPDQSRFSLLKLVKKSSSSRATDSN